TELPKRPSSMKLPLSINLSSLSCAFKSPDSLRLSSFFWPPIRDAAVRFSSSLLSNSPCFMILFPLVFNVVFFNRQPIERFFVQLRKISGCQMNFSVLARKRIQEQAIDMFEKPVEFS